MPLIAHRLDGGRVDATTAAADEWTTLRGAALHCADCTGRMVARSASTRAVQHFAHYRHPAACASLGETAEHLALKAAVVAAVRAVDGWTGELEVSGPDWRADVLATRSDGRRVAFEVQRSSIAAETAQERTRRHTRDGMVTCWLDLGGRAALAGLPSLRVDRDGDDWHVHPRVWECVGTYSRSRGIPWGQWTTTKVPLTTFIDGVCRGTVTYGGGWTTQKHREAAAAYAHGVEIVRRMEEQARERQEREARELLEIQAKQLADIVNGCGIVDYAAARRLMTQRARRIRPRNLRFTVAEVAYMLMCDPARRVNGDQEEALRRARGVPVTSWKTWNLYAFGE